MRPLRAARGPPSAPPPRADGRQLHDLQGTRPRRLVTSVPDRQEVLRLKEIGARGERMLARWSRAWTTAIFTKGVDGRSRHHETSRTEPPRTGTPAGRSASRTDRDGGASTGRGKGHRAPRLEEGQGWSGKVTGRTATGRLPAHTFGALNLRSRRPIIGTAACSSDLRGSRTQRRSIQREKLASLGEVRGGVSPRRSETPRRHKEGRPKLLSSGELGVARCRRKWRAPFCTASSR